MCVITSDVIWIKLYITLIVDGLGLSNTVHCESLTQKTKVDTVLAIERGLNYLPVAIRWSTSVIKVSVQMCANTFKRRLGFIFIVIIFANISLTLSWP